MMTCDNCGGLIGEAGTMISGRVCQCGYKPTSATSDTRDMKNPTIFTWNEDRQKEIETLRSRLAEVEKELQASKEMILAYEKELGKKLNPEWVKVGQYPVVGMIAGMKVHEEDKK